MSTATDLNVSLEPHLIEILHPLVSVLPQDLSAQLSSALDIAALHLSAESELSTAPISSNGSTFYARPLIRYSLLSAISSWARSTDGRGALSRRDPPLDPSSYAMVSLLAGTQTSPEKTFPHEPRKPDSGEVARKEVNDKRAVTAIFNALLSILGSGAATWWAADRLKWKDEWVRLLFVYV
jgi:hypothetical protein